jgi:hypothetical protein
MSNLAPKIQTPEQTPGQHEIIAAFGDAQQAIYKMTIDAQFQLRCATNNVDPYEDMDKPAYWDTVAEHAEAMVARTRERQVDSVRLSAFQLLACTPSYVFQQDAIDNEAHRNSVERHQGKRVMSYYNNLIRNFGANYPETNTTDLSVALLNMTNRAIESPTLQRNAVNQIRQTIRGAQHELGFGQILEYTSRDYRTTAVDEDLKGIDYIIGGNDAPELRVDVKASLSEIEHLSGRGMAYAVKRDGKIVMYSLIKDKEFHGTFQIGEASAQEKASTLNTLLYEAASQQMRA